MGLYFAFLTVFMLTACLLSENLVHSIVNEDFFKMAVAIPLLKFIFAMVCVMLFLAGGVLQFIYEYDITTKKTVKPVQKVTAKMIPSPVAAQGFDDYYYVVDNSASMEWNDPNNERIRLLSRIVDNLPDTKQIALISFGEVAEILIPLQFASPSTKKSFKSYINNPRMFPSTDIMGALSVTSQLLSNDASRRGVVIFISDGESDDNNFNSIVSSFTLKKIPVNTIMLNPN
ncbi:MAG: VWA domain-containing protein, partial [Bacteroidales bacterium]|nr:VWA domain-containing protein [Bacteroidales bacterium]